MLLTWKSVHGNPPFSPYTLNPPFSPYTLNIRKYIHTLALYSYIKAITGRRREDAMRPYIRCECCSCSCSKCNILHSVMFGFQLPPKWLIFNIWVSNAKKPNTIRIQYLYLQFKKKSFLQIQMYLLIILNSRKFKWFTFFLFCFFIAKSVQNKQI